MTKDSPAIEELLRELWREKTGWGQTTADYETWRRGVILCRVKDGEE